MILLDFSQTMVATWVVAQLQGRNDTHMPAGIGLVRHLALNTIRANRTKFRNKFGELVIAADSGRTWRHDFFPEYKASRKKSREDSGIDWEAFGRDRDTVLEEMENHFPYPVVKVKKAEGDDVIATLAKRYHATEPVLVLSTDKDFSQLQALSGVEQYNPVQKKMVECTNPELFLKEHVIRGDQGDGIPNFLSPHNSFTDGIRQKSIQSKKLEEWLLQDPEKFCTEETLPRYRRNERLIDFNFIPQELADEIDDSYRAQLGKERKPLFEYFARSGLRELTQYAGDF